MDLLTKTYFSQRKGWVLIGAIFSIVLAIILGRHIGGTYTPALLLAMALFGFPYLAKTRTDQILRLCSVGLYLSLAFVYWVRLLSPLGWIGCVGSIIFGTLVICLRYEPPKMGTGQSAT